MKRVVILVTMFFCSVTARQEFLSDELLVRAMLDRSLQFHESKEYYKELILLDASLIFNHVIGEIFKRKANAYRSLNNDTKAEELYQLALANGEHGVDVYVSLASIASDVFLFTKALEIIDTGLQRYPDNIHLVFQQANILNLMNRTKEALFLYERIRAVLPTDRSVRYNIAYTIKKLGDNAGAIALYSELLNEDPNYHQARFSRGLAYLSIGEFDLGWIDYEARWDQGDGNTRRNLSRPMWDGGDICGKTIFLHCEQGLGDTFQFIRYAKLLKEKGARVLVAAQKPLVSVLRLCPYLDGVTALQDGIPAYDVHAPLVSLPLLFKTRLDTIPQEVPYLYADESLIQFWAERLAADTGFKVGICFQGNSGYSTPMLRAVVKHKSAPLSKFKRLADCHGVSLYNLQKETGLDQLNDCDFGLYSFDEDFDNVHGRFMDTAAVMKNLDLVITVDTSIAHFAAGLGVPVWVMLPEPADWRWMLDREDTPWYPNMRLFRQKESDNWDELFDRMANELSLLIKNHKKLD